MPSIKCKTLVYLVLQIGSQCASHLLRSMTLNSMSDRAGINLVALLQFDMQSCRACRSSAEVNRLPLSVGWRYLARVLCYNRVSARLASVVFRNSARFRCCAARALDFVSTRPDLPLLPPAYDSQLAGLGVGRYGVSVLFELLNSSCETSQKHPGNHQGCFAISAADTVQPYTDTGHSL